jgi:hypothetical protein
MIHTKFFYILSEGSLFDFIAILHYHTVSKLFRCGTSSHFDPSGSCETPQHEPVYRETYWKGQRKDDNLEMGLNGRSFS